MPGAIVTPSDRKKIEPLVMMANERSPVVPTEIGCSSAKCADTAAIDEALHVEAAGVIVVAHYKGLSVAEVSELRRGMRDAGAAFRVTKNTLARIALADTPYATLDRLFIGPTAIAYSADPIAAPKAAVDFAKRNDKLAIVGGALPGNLLVPEQVRALAELPAIDELPVVQPSPATAESAWL